MTKVINFVAGPGSGKTTLAVQFFGYLKEQGIDVAYVPEYATEVVWRNGSLDDQLYITAKHHNDIYILMNQVDVIVTDSSLILGMYYVEESLKKYNEVDVFDYDNLIWAVKNLVGQLFNLQDSIVFFPERIPGKFSKKGRVHDEAASKEIDNKLKELLDNYRVPYYNVKTLADIIDEYNKISN